jgi:hypothetical protein
VVEEGEAGRVDPVRHRALLVVVVVGAVVVDARPEAPGRDQVARVEAALAVVDAGVRFERDGDFGRLGEIQIDPVRGVRPAGVETERAETGVRRVGP